MKPRTGHVWPWLCCTADQEDHSLSATDPGLCFTQGRPALRSPVGLQFVQLNSGLPLSLTDIEERVRVCTRVPLQVAQQPRLLLQGLPQSCLQALPSALPLRPSSPLLSLPFPPGPARPLDAPAHRTFYQPP